MKRVVELHDTRAGRILDISVQGLILFSLLAFSIETLPTLPAGLRAFLAWGEVITVALFTLEYLLRLLVADRPMRYALSFFGIVDLLAILPFYVARGLDLRALRALRFLRLFRLFKLVRYSRAIRRIHTALLLVREELVMFLSVTLLLLFFSAAGIHYFERDVQPEAFASVFHSLWWAVATLTTVGYGDVYPITVGGRLFTFVVLMVGLGVVAVPCGMLASALSEARRIEREGNRPDQQTGVDEGALG